MKSYNTLFILGNPRSGTSLLRLMLHNHKSIVSPPESGFSHWWLSKWGNWEAQDNTLQKISYFVDDIFKSKKIELWKLNKDTLLSIIYKEKPENYGQLIQCVYLAFEKNYSDVEVIADKNNYYIKHLKDLPKIWPNAKYLHIVRDGRDVACSYQEVTQLNSNSPYKPQLPATIAEIASEWESNNFAINQFTSSMGHNSFLVKYEDLILNTKETLLSICEFLKIAFDEQMLNYYNVSSENKQEPNETLEWKKKTLESPDNNRIKRYLKDLNESDIKAFNQVALESLKYFGYA